MKRLVVLLGTHAIFISTTALAATTTTITAPNYTYSQQDVRNGASAVAASANYGRGIKFGVVDTGIAPSVWFNPSYNGQGLQNIDTVKSGTCLNGSCRYVNPVATPTDSMGHGTFVASEIVGGLSKYGYASVAPAGQLLSVQVFGASGGASGVDVANGIRFAADGGANVINLSLGPSGGTAAQQAAFYSSLASAINYAAGKNATVVFAAGNSAQVFAGNGVISGLSDAALQRLVIVGSTNAAKQLSSFSNTAGSGRFVSTTGRSYDVRSLFLVAEGENLVGASNYGGAPCTGYTCLTRMSGTSMAAPLVTGGVGLLEARWPVLLRNGTAVKVLTTTATDLGSKGVDATYGNGFMNLTQAFQPVGALAVNTTKGTQVPVTQVTGSLISSGALGNLSSISSQLANFTAFDTFSRDFGVNLSGLVTSKPTSSGLLTSTQTPAVKTSAARFTDGSTLSFGQVEEPATHNTTEPARHDTTPQAMVANYSDAKGSVTAVGYGVPASSSFAAALWGAEGAAATQSASVGASNSLLGLAEGGSFAAYGTKLSGDTRLAIAWSQTERPGSSLSQSTNAADASATMVGLTTTVTPAWKAGISVGMLDEHDGMLGSTYAHSPVSFGKSNSSAAVGISSAVKLSSRWDLMVDASVVRTNGSAVNDSLITNVSEIYARSYGASLVTHDAAQPGDHVSFGVKAPLRVMSGSATLTTNGVDADGYATVASTKVGLTPSGEELKLQAHYEAPEKDGLSWHAALEASKDAGNVADQSDVTMLVGGKLRF